MSVVLFIKNHKLKISFYLLSFMVLLLFFCNLWIINSTQSQIYNDIDEIPKRKVGLVLGANKYSKQGKLNHYFTYRIFAANQLYKAKKITYLLVSGDNHIKGYDEPTDMRNELVKMGVPDSCIISDFAGFRTFDSVERTNKVFSEDSITIITQEFHNQRALFIANQRRINAIAFNANEVSKTYSIKTTIREYFARVRCVLDIYVFRTSPKFLGDKIKIGQ